METEASDVRHQPVMTDEVLRLLQPRPGMTMVDGTVGTGGHSRLLLPRLLPGGRLIAMDRDPQALAVARTQLAAFEPQVTFVHGNFKALAQIVRACGLTRVDGVLLDLGMSSLQVETPARGFSFLREGPLDMRMDPSLPLSAEEIVNRWSPERIETALTELGEERFARRIARRIVEARRLHPLTSTTQLAALVCSALPRSARHGRLHAATRTFQALRLSVNEEPAALEAALESLPEVLATGGRAVILSFHSIEDRLVKQALVRGIRAGTWQGLTKKPLRPSEEETARNPRARSARLRAVERA